MHKLLERQVQRHLGERALVSPELGPFLEAVDEAYRENDTDRALLERSLELTSQELTERYATLRAQHDQLQQLDEFRTQFLNNAAHELGTPLTPIKLQIHLLKNQMDPRTNADERKSIEILDRNVERLGQLVHDVLDAARLQAGRLKVQHEPVSLHQILRESVDSFRENARHTNVSLELGRNETVVVMGDGRRLVQVLFNLLTNAFKFTPPGGRVIVESTRKDDGVLVRVEDTGVGLRPEDLPRLFQAFSQVHDPMLRTRAGTGLGLYISRGIVEDLGGHIWAESPGPGLGATFCLWIPRGRLATKNVADVLAAPASIAGRTIA